jgi:hypothetical protein
MSPPRDPRRWHLDGDDSVPDRLRQAMAAARSDLPPPHVLHRMAAGVAPLLAASSKAAAAAALSKAAAAGASASATGAGPTAVGAVVIKAIAIGALAGVTAVGGSAAYQRATHRGPWQQPTSSSSALGAPSPDRVRAQAKPLPSQPNVYDMATEPEPPILQSAPASSTPATRTPPRGVGLESAPGRSADVAPAIDPAPAVASATVESSEPGASRAVPPALGGPPRTEAQILEAARAALEVRPLDALALADEHRALYAHGTLAQERELIAVDALERLGRSQEARARAIQFRAQFPRSAHMRRIETIVGGFE